MKTHSRIYVTGHQGMVGSALVRELNKRDYKNILTQTKQELNLLDWPSVERFFKNHKPEYVFLAAARVGGIKANIDFAGDFLYENLQIQNNIIHACQLFKVDKLCFLGSSCIYPRDCDQPMKEEYLLTGKLEPTNDGYALAKIAGLMLCQKYEKQYGMNSITPMPCNLYGENDSFDLEKSHVLSALVKRFVDAVDQKNDVITLWGSGLARREFLHVDDLARILVELMIHHHSSELINIGAGEDISIKELANKIAQLTGFEGKIQWDTSKPDGMPRKCMDISKMKKLGYLPMISLEQGIIQMIENYKKIKHSL